MRNKQRVLTLMFLIIVILFVEAYYIKNNQSMGNSTHMPVADVQSELINGGEYKQTFECSTNNLEGIILKATYSTIYNPEYLEVELSADGRVIQKWKLSKFDLNNSLYKLVLNKPQLNVKGKKYNLILKSKGDTGVLINLTTKSDSSTNKLTCNGKEKEGVSICYSLLEKNVSKWEAFGAVGVFSIVAISLLTIILYRKKRYKVEVVFLTCYIIMGVIQFFSVPIFKTPDEGNHFLRAYEISQGYFVSEQRVNGMKIAEKDEISENQNDLVEVGRELPTALLFGGALSWDGMTNMKLYDLKEMSKYYIEKGNTTYVSFPNTALYAPGTYFPQVVGIKFMSLFSDNALMIAYSARFFNWLITGILIMLAIRYMPMAKNMMLLISLIPMNMQQYNSMSPDAFTFGICAVLISFVLYHKYNTSRLMSTKDYVIMYVLIIILCQCKIVYVPLCLLLFLIPIEHFGNKRKYIINVCVAAMMACIVCFGWLKISSGLLVEIQPGVNSSEQVLFILQHPIQYITTIIRTVDLSGDTWFRWGLGETLGWLNITTSYIGIFVYAVIIVIYLFLDNDISEYEYKIKDRIILGGVGFIVIALICTSLYVQWTSYRSPVIEGVQGRYFLPILLPILLAIKPPKNFINNNGLNNRFGYLVALGINLCISTILLTNAI